LRTRPQRARGLGLLDRGAQIIRYGHDEPVLFGFDAT
jgi:hypothetical protein